MADRIRAFDWAATPLGPIEAWSPALRTTVNLVLANRFPMLLWWGPQYIQLYNDAYRPVPGNKHPLRSLGRPGSECWSEIWHIIGPLVDTPFRGGAATWMDDILLEIHRHGFVEESHFTIAYSAVPDETVPSGIGGVLATVNEITEKIIGERRVVALRDLGAQTIQARSSDEVCLNAAKALGKHGKDVPFALFYLIENHGRHARLAATSGVDAGTAFSPASVDLSSTADCGWPLREVRQSENMQVVEQLASKFSVLPPGPWSDPPGAAVVLPIRSNKTKVPFGLLVAGISSRLKFDNFYRSFFELLTAQVSTAIASARVLEDEKKKAEALAEIDRAKTVFFSNVSHEFRTPLTLMLGPVEDLLSRGCENVPPSEMKDELEIVNRNALRLLRLVNSLLDFSRIEAGRHKALFQPTDLAAFSADLASVFRSACEKAGLRLNIDCPSLSQPVFVDREMWEKIVLNLLSNAFKFTFEGEIAVSLRQSGNNVQLRVRDTGSGIPPDEMPRLFERFHRIENAKSRTNEGSGIGLALVQELVKLHGGSISAESEPGRGTTFIVSIPLGSKHLPNDQLGEADEVTATAAWATAYIEEALCWLPEKLPEIRQQAAVEGPFFRSEDGAAAGKQRILVADDNADMRQYIERLLSDQYDVQTVPDGEAALAAIRARAPDLLLTDAMMPKLDGFGLLQQLRADPGTSALPVIMLSARAGEESRVEGMAGGADDYLVKPFSARELVVRVAARLQMAHLRREAGEALRQSHARFEALVNAAPIGIFLVDANLRIRQVNPKARPFFGDTKELIGSDFEKVMRSLWAPDLAGEFVNRVRDTLKSGTPYFVPEFSGQRLDRSGIEYYECEFHRIWLPDGSCGVVCYFSDISRHVLVRQALAENEQWMRNNQRKLRLVADHAPVLIAHCDSDGRYKFVNKPYAASFGLHPKDVVGKCIEEVVGESTYARFKEHVEKALSGEPTEFEVEIPFKVGGTQFVRCGYTPEWDGGTVVGFVAAITNITDRKRAEEGLREADRKKSEFIATLAHELRNPLAPISSGLRVMRTTGGNHEKTQQMMERQVQHMVRLVDDLMDVSRISQGKLTLQKERIDLAAVLNSAVETSRPDIEKAGQQLRLQLPPQPIIVEADAVRLSQVFTNLLNNAAKYSDRHGLIRLAVKLQGSSAVVSVRDEGIGIAGDQLPHIFKMFSQVDRSIERSRGGLGIGLSLVSRLVDMHGGTIEAHSEGLGKGSEFIVKLPILAGASPAQPKPSRDYASMKSSLRVLVVDDNRDSADTLAMVLQLSGNETQVSYDGEQALRAYDSFRPDVMLLDIGMPTLSGHEICRRIRSKPCGKNVVMIAQTGWGQDEDRKMTQEAGFDHHMTKPVSTDAIMKILTGLKK